MLTKAGCFSINLLQLLCIALLATTEVAGAQVVQIGSAEIVYDCNPQAGFGYMNRNVKTMTPIDSLADPPSSPFSAPPYQFWYDAPMNTLRQNNRITFLYFSANGTDKFEGDLSSTTFGEVSGGFHRPIHDMWNNDTNVATSRLSRTAYTQTGKVKLRYDATRNSSHGVPFFIDVPWIPNVYEISGNGADSLELLGFVHLESTIGAARHDFYSGTNVSYQIGIAYYNKRNGEKWTYCGDVIRPSINAGTGSNIGGIPYVVNRTNDSFYVYFNDFARVGSRHDKRLCVARARISDVVSNARKGKVISWQKYNSSSGWTSDALNSVGTSVIPHANFPSGIASRAIIDSQEFDLHADAAFCKPLNKYLLTANTGGYGQLFLYSSSDGIAWDTVGRVESNWDCDGTIHGMCLMQVHSFFASLDPDAADDCHDVGRTFFIYYSRTFANTRIADLHHQWLLRRKVTIVPGTGR
jgi:hypothetical protein